MSAELLIVLAVVIAGFAALFFALRRRSPRPEENQALLMLQNQINEISRMIDSKILESAKLMQTQTSAISENMQRIIRDITERLLKVARR